MRRWTRVVPLVLLPRWVQVSPHTTSRPPAALDDDEAEEDRLVRQLIQGCDDGEVPQLAAALRGGGGAAHEVARDATDSPSSSGTETDSAALDSGVIGEGDKQRETDHMAVARKFVSVRLAKNNRVEWQCVKCSAYNILLRKLCGSCGLSSTASHRTTQPLPARIAALLPSEWYCNVGTCRHLNRTKNNTPDASQRKRYLCESCSAPFQGVHDWYCPKCQVLNPRGCVQCTGCFQARPVGWKCEACGEERNSVFGTACATCRTSRPIVASEMKQGGVIVCSKCRARNHSQWELCSCCVAPLPALLDSLGLPYFDTLHDGTLSSCSTTVDEQASRAAHSTLQETYIRSPAPPQRGGEGTDVERRHFAPSSAPSSTDHSDRHKDDPLRNDGDHSLPQRPTHVWKCTTCKIQHQMSMPYCDTCLQSRETALAVEGPVLYGTADAKVSRPTPAVPTGTWCCSACQSENQPTARRCQQCHHERVLDPGYWQCTRCSSVNKNTRLLCVGCFDTNPEFDETHLVLGSISDRSFSWHCIDCGFDKNSDTENLCSKCNSERHGWVCPSCSKRNNLSAPRCSACDGKRESAKQRCVMCKAPTAIGLPSCQKCRSDIPNFDVWECKECQFSRNSYLTSAACQKCGCTRRSARRVSLWVCPTCRAIGRAWSEDDDAQTPNATSETTQKKDKPKEICSRCAKPRPADVSVIPSRWICWKCSTSNGISAPQCSNAACKATRRVKWNTTVDCPKCLKSTLAGVDERCSHCQHSLSTLLSSLHSVVVMDEAEVAKWIPTSVSPIDQRQGSALSPGLEDSSENDFIGETDVGLVVDLRAEAAVAEGSGAATPTTQDRDIAAGVVAAAQSDHDQDNAKRKLHWVCSLCGARNRMDLTECEKCGMPPDL